MKVDKVLEMKILTKIYTANYEELDVISMQPPMSVDYYIQVQNANTSVQYILERYCINWLQAREKLCFVYEAEF